MLLSLTRWGMVSLLIFVASTVSKPTAAENGIVTCRPGIKFLRDCGNECVCQPDGKGADCTSRACPKDFQTSMRQEVEHVYNVMDQLRSDGNGPIFTCVPRSSRKINSHGGTCFCTTSGKAEVCSEHPGSPWGT